MRWNFSDYLTLSISFRSIKDAARHKFEYFVRKPQHHRRLCESLHRYHAHTEALIERLFKLSKLLSCFKIELTSVPILSSSSFLLQHDRDISELGICNFDNLWQLSSLQWERVNRSGIWIFAPRNKENLSPFDKLINFSLPPTFILHIFSNFPFPLQHFPILFREFENKTKPSQVVSDESGLI